MKKFMNKWVGVITFWLFCILSGTHTGLFFMSKNPLYLVTSGLLAVAAILDYPYLKKKKEEIKFDFENEQV